MSKEHLKKRLAVATRVLNHCLKSESAPRINAMLDLARSESGIPVLPDSLDRDPWLLNCANGTLDLRSGELRAHNRDDLLTKLCPTAYRPTAACSAWQRFLEAIFPATSDTAETAGNGPLITFAQRLLGYWLTGDVREQILPIFWGSGSNGKSTLLNAFMATVGEDYAIQGAPDFLLAKKGSHPTERADLFGRRLVTCVETEDGARLAEALVKALTGGERVKARRMREDFWEFDPTHKIVLCTNHKPKVRGTEHAIWRRILLVPFTVTIPDAQQDKDLPAKLQAEAEGILAWCVRGCLDWQRYGLGIPDEVKAVTRQYRCEQDLLAGFLAECCQEKKGDHDYRVRASDLYGAFRAWCEASGEAKGSEIPSQRKVGEALTDRGFERTTSNGTWYLGLALRQEDNPAQDVENV